MAENGLRPDVALDIYKITRLQSKTYGGTESIVALDIYKITRLQSHTERIHAPQHALDIYKITRLQSHRLLRLQTLAALDIYKITRLQSLSNRSKSVFLFFHSNISHKSWSIRIFWDAFSIVWSYLSMNRRLCLFALHSLMNACIVLSLK